MGVQRAAARAAERPGTANVAPAAVSSAAVARWVGRIQASMTQPVNSHTSAPVADDRRPRRSGEPRRGRGGAGRAAARWASASTVDPASSSRWRPRTAKAEPQPARRRAVGSSARASRVPSMRCPNGTPLGQAGSQPRHCTHVSMNRTNSSSAVGAAPLHAAHGVDPAPRRQPLLARDPERRAVRQAQPARHARRQLARQPELQGSHRHPATVPAPQPRWSSDAGPRSSTNMRWRRRATDAAASGRRSGDRRRTARSRRGPGRGGRSGGAPVGEAALGLGHRRRVGPAGPQPHQGGRDQAQVGDRLGRRVPGAATARTRRRTRRTTGPATPSASTRSSIGVVPRRRARGRAGPSRAAPGPSAVITTLPGWTSPWHTTRRRPARPNPGGARPGLDAGTTPRRRARRPHLGEQLVEPPPREATRTAGAGRPAGTVRRGEVVHAGDHLADRPPVGLAGDGRAAPTPSPPGHRRRRASARAGAGHAHARRRSTSASSTPAAGGRRRPADPQHDVAGGEQRVHPRRAAAPAPAVPSRGRPVAADAAASRTGPGGRSTNGRSAIAGSRVEHVDAGVEPTGRVEGVLDPPVQLATTGSTARRRRRLARGARSRRRARRRTARCSRRCSPGAIDHRPPSAAPAGRSPASSASRRPDRRRRAVALEQHPHRGAVPQHRTSVGTAGPARRPGSTAPVNHCSKRARGRVRRITSPRKPSVPRDPTSSRHRSNPLTFFTVGPPALTTSPAADT